MKAIPIALLPLMLMVSSAHGQSKKYFSVELGGVGGLGSINYETSFHQRDNLTLTYRTGFSFIPIDKNNGTVLVFPQLIHGTYGKDQHFVDVGIGLAPSFTTTFGGLYLRMPASFGYRLEPRGKNYFFRMAYTPLVSFLLDFQLQHWFGVACGFSLHPPKR